MSNSSNSLIKIPKEILKEIKDKYIILIIGSMGCGKTTESCEIVKSLEKPGVVLVHHHEHESDKNLHERYNIERIPVGLKQIKPKIQKLRKCILIYDDFKSANKRQQNNIREISNDLRKRELNLILIYHSRKIPVEYINNADAFLIVKDGARLNRNKLGQYFNVKGIASSAEEYCNKNIKKHDSVYISNDGTYYHRDGKTNEIIKNKFTSKSTIDIDDDKLKDLLLNQEKTQSQIADELCISESSIYKEIKRLKKEDKNFAETYRKSKKKKIPGSSHQVATRKKSGLTVQYEVETLKTKNGKSTKSIKKMQNIQDIGDYATEIVGDAFVKEFKDAISKSLLTYIDIIIRKSRGGADIEIDLDNKIYEIEIKNQKTTKDRQYLTKYDIKNDVITRFIHSKSKKYLFTCGKTCNEEAQKLLKKEKIKYIDITTKQILKGQQDNKNHVEKKIHEFVNKLL